MRKVATSPASPMLYPSSARWRCGPCRPNGTFVPNDNDVSVIVDRIAKKHLGLGEARSEFAEALKVVEVFDQRDPIESAQNHLQTVSEQAYFYAGLAFGVTLADLSR